MRLRDTLGIDAVSAALQPFYDYAAGEIILFEIKNENMVPTLPLGGEAVVDTGRRIPNDGGVYAVRSSTGEVAFYRFSVVTLSPLLVEAVRDNPLYWRGDGQRILAEELDIVGRVVNVLVP